MKKSLLVALAISASIGSQVELKAAVASGTIKLGSLSFALTDTFQGPSSRGVRTNPGNAATTNTVDNLLACSGSYKYQSSVRQLNNPAILRAISTALTGVDYKQVGGSGNGVFTSKAKLLIANYDNVLPGPPYPPYLPQLSNLGPANTLNSPRVPDYDTLTSPPGVTNNLVDSTLATAANVGPSAWIWPNLHQIDWVDYDGLASRNASIDSSLWPKSQVFVSDSSNASLLYSCVNVTPFFSFEEAYCYFCWDTVDRVTDGTLTTGTSDEICIGSSCGSKGSGTTRFYMTIKFNNNNGLNSWLNTYGPSMVAAPANIIAPWLPSFLPYTYPRLELDKTGKTILVKPLPVEAWLQFSVGGVVVYPWSIKTVQTVRTAFGTMTMAQATGFGNNPWCGVLVGSVKIAEGTDVGNPICLDTINWPFPQN